MDVELVQKINKLALELMNQGLAQSRDEAVIQAESFLRRKEKDYSYSSEIRGRVEEGRREIPPEGKSPPEQAMSTDEIKNILQQNSQFLVKTIKEFQEQVKAMEQEIALLKNKLANAVRPVSSPPAAEAPVRGQSKPAEGHPRLGTYKTEDVSIEKFFYAGNK